MFDDTAPLRLIALQTWFGGAITTTSDGEAASYLTQNSIKRIKIYREQYLLRLTKVLEKNYPFLHRLFGPFEFNTYANAYILEKPPITWSLQYLGETFPDWLEKNYKNKDREFVANAANLDWKWHLSQISGKLEPSHEKGILQPHAFFLETKGDLIALRKEMLKFPADHWKDHPFPHITPGTFYFVLYRNNENSVCYKQLDHETYIALQKTPLEEALLNEYAPIFGKICRV